MSQVPEMSLARLERLDERLSAHLDALSISRDNAWPFCAAAFESPSADTAFVAMVRCVEDQAAERVERVLAVAEAEPAMVPGVIAALGWVERIQLRGLVADMLASAEPFRRLIGVAACAVHRVDPGIKRLWRVYETDGRVRARVLRTAGELGLVELSHICAEQAHSEDPHGAFWAARSAALLGDRSRDLHGLARIAGTAGPFRRRAFAQLIQAMDPPAAHQMLQRLASESADAGWLIYGSGLAGCPDYVPWLITQMQSETTARVAAEAFSLITGADLSALGFEASQPPAFEPGPNDDPDDPHVEMDPDEGLPWPDVAKIETWWAANASRFRNGTRYFMGAPVTRDHCIDVLKTGYQRQRILAAHYLCLLEPGTPLFNTSAPAWRQQRWLAKM